MDIELGPTSSLVRDTVDSFEEFSKVIADYYNYHFSICNSNGGRLSEAEACQTAKEIIINSFPTRLTYRILKDTRMTCPHTSSGANQRVIMSGFFLPRMEFWPQNRALFSVSYWMISKNQTLKFFRNRML